MRIIRNLTLCLLCLALALGAAEIVRERDRSKIPDKYKWALTDLYAGDDAWNTAKENLKTSISWRSRHGCWVRDTHSVLSHRVRWSPWRAR